VPNNLKISSNRSFGLVFSIFFLILALWPLINNNPINIWLIIVSLIFLILGLMNSKILYPLNKLWFKFGIALGAIVAPVVMGIIFFILITPIGILMKIMGKDLLNSKYNKNINSYWIKRDKSVGSMKKQF
tara:strand:+ start:160 stop:549 length:390 start_codon:yes stop_codon:yes gene_type:complete